MLHSIWPIIVASLAITGTSASQIPLTDSSPTDASIRTLTHPSHPKHSLTITSHSLDTPSASRNGGSSLLDVCPGATSGYTGYLHSGTKHFYFAYFESRSKPKTDPLVLWLNGGPGCSSLTGLFFELGPCFVNADGSSARKNEHSWINNANVFFLDQPIGVGFSYSSNHSAHGGEGGTFAASEDIYAFMQLWYQAFPDSKSLPFSIAGESYGGHYIPIFASHIQEMNAIADAEYKIPLESVLIGNGIFSSPVQTTSSYDITCTNATGIGPLLSDPVCEKIAAAVPRCEFLMKACEAYPDPLICGTANNYCAKTIEYPYFESGLNYYDVSKPCEGPLCYPIMGSITNFLRTDEVREAFGVDKEAPKFQACSNDVGREFSKANDGMIDTRPYVADLLHGGVRVLIYVGTYDWICNFVGNERVFGSLEWKGLANFRYQQENNKQVWKGGLWWESGDLRYVRVNGAGHMVPADKPEDALHMFNAWHSKKGLE